MITKLRLKNWRSHLDSEFNFSAGTNALLGSMGAGKTSVTDSICFALFGTFPTLQSKKLKLDDIIMKKPIEKNRAEVELQFQLNGSTYFIKRIIEKGKGTNYSEIRENENLLESPSSQRVTELVEKILKINYDLFSKAVYSEQNALDYFLRIPRGQRMKKIDELLMIDKFEKARSSVVKLTNKIIERKLGKQTVVDKTEIKELEKNINELKNEITKTMKGKDELEKQLKEVTLEKEKVEKELLELKKIKENLNLLKRDETGIESATEETRRHLESLEKSLKGKRPDDIQKELLEVEKRVENLEKDFKEKQENYEKIYSEISQSKTKLEFLKNEKIKKLEKEFEEKLMIKKDLERMKASVGEDAFKRLEEKKKLIENLIGEIEGTKIKIIDLSETLKQLSTSKGKCPVCESLLSEERKNTLIKQKQQQIETLKKKIKEANKKKQLNERELENLEESIKKLDEMLVQIKDFEDIKTELENSKKIFMELNETNSKTKSQLISIKKNLEELRDRLKETLNKKQELEILFLKSKDYQEKKKRFKQLSKERRKFAMQIEHLEKRFSSENLIKMENKLKNFIGQEREIGAKINGINQLLKEKEIRVKEYEKTLLAVKKEKDEIEKLEKIIQDLKVFAKALEQTQIELRTEFVDAVNYTMNKLWSTLYPYHDFIGIQLSIEGGDYVLQLKERSGRLVNAEGIASGGERSIACLALRIAFALVLAPQMKTLVLDEPTANLDSSAIKELATTFKERINEFIEQTFLITHQPELEDAVTGNCYRLERDKSRDGVTKVIPLVTNSF